MGGGGGGFVVILHVHLLLVTPPATGTSTDSRTIFTTQRISENSRNYLGGIC